MRLIYGQISLVTSTFPNHVLTINIKPCGAKCNYTNQTLRSNSSTDDKSSDIMISGQAQYSKNIVCHQDMFKNSLAAQGIITTTHKDTVQLLWYMYSIVHLNGWVQRRCNPLAHIEELRLFCTNSSIYNLWLSYVDNTLPVQSSSQYKDIFFLSDKAKPL